MYCETTRPDRIEDYIKSLALAPSASRTLPRLPRVPAEDPEARTLASPVYSWYQKANKLYQQRIGNDQRYIRLNSARRTTAKQGELNRGALATKKYGIGTYLPADFPGASMHEYGYAIDVDLNHSSVNAAQAIRALREVGFTDNIQGEPHHFEAVGARGHASVVSAIQKITGQGTWTYNYGENSVWLFDKCLEKKALVVNCADLIRRNKSAIDELRAKEIEVDRLSRDAQNALDNYNRLNADYTRALNRFETAKARAEDYPKIWRCRVGATIDQCRNVEHEPDRQQYRRELKRLQDDANARGVEAREAYQLALDAYGVHTRAQQALLTGRDELQGVKDKHRAVLVPIYQNDRRIKQAETAIEAFRNALIDLELKLSKYVRQNIP